ncbi:hypothetical protein BMS3Abin07_01424 [bacterium BMS3Abin07]|nr:hypothetical protein BMS3Abin07_01424 [bacterium BMS3Abin07]GBE33104.1 hypothetical protein BMS3Bbin05_02041 [bacterium BMS3Bbin05]HDO21798.1 hypothetical protein [Nitrospirota bacterium]HDZ88774.1 hypothetical protein [Nitrospirota bacterium]
MLVGFNTNIPYKGKVYHVQTEDTGESAIIISLLYLKGAILASKKTSYDHLIGEPDIKSRVRELMKEQHKALIKALIHGRISVDSDVSESVLDKRASCEIKKYKSLDDILIDYIIERAGER